MAKYSHKEIEVVLDGLLQVIKDVAVLPLGVLLNVAPARHAAQHLAVTLHGGKHACSSIRHTCKNGIVTKGEYIGGDEVLWG